MADLELRIHRKLLERLDLYEFEPNEAGDTAEHPAAGKQHRGRLPRAEPLRRRRTKPLLEEITGLTLRDHLVNQLIMETGSDEVLRPGRR